MTAKFPLLLILLAALPARAAGILAAGDPIIAIDPDGASSSPAAEDVTMAIDGTSATKHLNFGDVNSGLIVTPASGASVIARFVIITANDTETRDPASYELYGTNDAITSAAHSDGTAET